jgi:NADPH:quinone reductase-like Zn-dependent oxidoreductase
MTAIIRVHATGGPETLSWESDDVRAPGPGEVRVRHTAIGINYSDVPTAHRDLEARPAVGSVVFTP